VTVSYIGVVMYKNQVHSLSNIVTSRYSRFKQSVIKRMNNMFNWTFTCKYFLIIVVHLWYTIF